jgi:hypothetical protein
MMAVARLEMLLVHIFYSQGKDLLLPVIKYSVVDLYKTRVRTFSCIHRIGYKSQCTRFLYVNAKRCKSTFFQPAVHDVNNVLNWISDLSSVYTICMRVLLNMRDLICLAQKHINKIDALFHFSAITGYIAAFTKTNMAQTSRRVSFKMTIIFAYPIDPFGPEKERFI